MGTTPPLWPIRPSHRQRPLHLSSGGVALGAVTEGESLQLVCPPRSQPGREAAAKTERTGRRGSGHFPLPQLTGRAGKTSVGVDLLHSCPPESWWGGQAFALGKLKASDLGFTSLPGSWVWECGLIQPIRCSCPELLSQSDASAQNHVANQM